MQTAFLGTCSHRRTSTTSMTGNKHADTWVNLKVGSVYWVFFKCPLTQWFLDFRFHKTCCCCSVAKSCPTLCDPMDCSMPGVPVPHYLPELAQTHVHWVGDAIQPSHPLSSPSPPALNFSHIQAAAAKSLQLCPTLCDPIDGSPPGSTIPGILQARTLEWVAISFSNAWKWKVKGKSLSRVRLLATPWTTAYQAPLSMGFSRQEYWSGVPLPSLIYRPLYIK